MNINCIKMMKKIVILFVTTILISLFIIVCSEAIVHFASKGKTYDSIESTPQREYALLLGTSPYFTTGENPYYRKRIDATYELYKKGKFKKLIISGDRSGDDYDETISMQNDLIEKGIPKSIMLLDPNGQKTAMSITNVRKKFHADNILIISQKFHNERAIFLANKQDINAIAYNADNFMGKYWQIRMFLRERGSRVKAVWLD